MRIRIYHNPRCSKSRRALELLHEREADVEIVNYLETPPDARELTRIIELLGLEPRELMRTEEQPYEDEGLDDESLTRTQLIEAMVSNPILIQRPIVVAGNRALIGRPPERVLEILQA